MGVPMIRVLAYVGVCIGVSRLYGNCHVDWRVECYMRARTLKPKTRQKTQEARGTAGQAFMFRVYRGKLRLSSTCFRDNKGSPLR